MIINIKDITFDLVVQNKKDLVKQLVVLVKKDWKWVY